jgi:alpha,alpha-trehalose phosphorylase
MSPDPGRPFTVEPWVVREPTLDMASLGVTETVFALSNGHIGLRGNLDEGEPNGLPGTYLNGLYESIPLPYAEAGYGYPESGQTVVNATNGKLIRLLVEDEPFDVRYGHLESHERCLDLRTGTLTREAVWTSPTGERVKITSTRLVSFAQRAVAAIDYRVEPLDKQLRVVAQSELVANEPLPGREGDPRAAAVATALDCEHYGAYELRGFLVHTTKTSNLRMAAAYDHVVECDGDLRVARHAQGDFARTTFSTTISPGKPLRIVKIHAYGWSARRSMPALRDQVSAAVTEAMHTGWDDLARLQSEYLDSFWSRVDVEIDGEARLQQALRFGMFHVLQAGARTEGRAIPAKGLTGSGYDGHAFWDTETFVLPMLTYSVPDAARDALEWRYATLDKAKQRAKQLGLEGAAFPWRTIAGEECSSYWPAGTAAFHVNADIANAAARYWGSTADEDFAQRFGIEILVETARLWRSLGHHDAEGAFRIDGVTGPDEYSAVADNNIYTNLCAQKNLLDAATAVEDFPAVGRELGVDAEEAASWRDAAMAMVVPYDETLGVHQQSEDYTDHARWDFENTPPDAYPLFLHYPYFDIYRKQVVKQADLVLALYLRGDAFTDEQKARDFAYYEPLTARDSSLSACTQAVIAAEVGHLDLAFDYMTEAALMDLDDLEHNAKDGIHMASLSGAWVAAVAGFGGMRDHWGRLSFKPRLPSQLSRLRYRLMFRHRVIEVVVTHDGVKYSLRSGEPLEITHYGEDLEVTTDASVERSIPPIDPGPTPKQPAHRGPLGARGIG